MPVAKKGLVFIILLSFLLSLVLLTAWYFNFTSNRVKLTPLPTSSTDKNTFGLSVEEIKKLAVIPIKEPLKNQVETINPEMSNRLDRVGNILYYQGDVNDKTGRTMLVDSKKSIMNWERGFGGGYYQTISVTSSLGIVSAIKGNFKKVDGIFQRWIPIVASEDYYAVLEDPIRKIQFAVRINRQPDNCPPIKGANGLTDFIVQNLDVPADENSIEDIGYFYNWGEGNLKKIIQPKDTIVVIAKELGNKQVADVNGKLQNISVGMAIDNVGVYCAQAIVIHRLGGKKQLENELAQKIDNVSFTPILSEVAKFYISSKL